MKIISWNVNGLRACADKGLYDFLAKEDPDMLCLQETKAHPDHIDPACKDLDGRESYWSAARRRGYSGTVTYLRQAPLKVEYGIGVRKYDDEGRFVITHHPEFLLYNVYFPNGGASEERHLFKQEFLDRFGRHLSKKLAQGQQIILVGDYNIAHDDIDVYDPVKLATESGFLPEERRWFGEFLQKGFVDGFRLFHPNEPHRYSWWSYREKGRMGNRGWRIDYICVSEGLKSRLKSADVMDWVSGSDHCPVVVELDL